MSIYFETLSRDNEEYADASEHYIFQYIQTIESFIKNYGYEKEISIIEEDASIENLENIIRNFLIKNANAWNHLEIFGTLKDFPEKEIFVCCYEPYGEELLCIEKRNNKLFFFESPNYKYGIKPCHINYFEEYDCSSDIFNL